MVRYAIIRNNTVENIVLWDGVSKWDPPEGALLVKASELVDLGWTYNEGNFSKPYIDLEQLKEEKRKLIADTRWEKTQYFTYDGEVTQASNSISALIGAIVSRQLYAQVNGAEPPDQVWKLNNTAFRTFNTAQLVQFGFEVQSYINKCFEYEETLSTLINNAQCEEDLDCIDLSWPST